MHGHLNVKLVGINYGEKACSLLVFLTYVEGTFYCLYSVHWIFLREFDVISAWFLVCFLLLIDIPVLGLWV